MVNEFPPEKIAGTAMATQALAEHLTNRGHQVLVLVTTSCPVEKQNQIKNSVFELKWIPNRPVRGIGLLWRIWYAWHHARCFKPDLLQGQAVSCGLVAAVVARLMGVPSICYAQGYDVYESSPLQQWTEIRWGCRWPTRLLTVTHDLRARICAIVGRNGTVMPHAFVLSNRLVSRDDARRRLALHDQDCLVCSVGRLEFFKGHDLLIGAWAAFVSQHPRAQLKIAGTGSRETTLRCQVAKLGVENSVHFMGHLSPDDVHLLLAASDLFVLPSRSEPFGIVLLEAMAHGLPIVATEVGGVPEVLPKRGDVKCIPPDNNEALISAMLLLVSGKFRSSQRNRNHALQFEWRLQVERFELIYSELLRGKYANKANNS